MTVNKPSILIYTKFPITTILKEICAGIEEEGIFYEIYEKDTFDIDELAFEAAADSMLGSGIGILYGKAVMQMRSLKKGENVFVYDNPNKEQCRTLGSNSARAIKRMPFKE